MHAEGTWVPQDPVTATILAILRAAEQPISVIELMEQLYEESLHQLKDEGSWRLVWPSLFIKFPLALSSGTLHFVMEALEEESVVYGSWRPIPGQRPWDRNAHPLQRVYRLFPKYR